MQNVKHCSCSLVLRASASEDITMATWGGSTAGNMESIEENDYHNSDDGDDEVNNEDDDDDDNQNNVGLGNGWLYCWLYCMFVIYG